MSSTADTALNSAPAIPIELLVWLSPSFPVGSFAYSHGLEWAAASGRITDRSTAELWLADILNHGALRNDAIVLAAAWRAAAVADDHALLDLNDLALALAGSRERRLETTAQGNAFRTTLTAAWPEHAGTAPFSAVTGDIAYSVAVAIAAASNGHSLSAMLQVFIAAQVSNLASALVRLSVVGQTDGQRIIAALLPTVRTLADKAERSTIDDIGGSAFFSDIAAMAHETQETRLFRT